MVDEICNGPISVTSFSMAPYISVTFFCRDVEADEEIVVNNIGRTTILDNEAGPPQEMVVLLNSQEKFQQPNGKISLA